MGDLPSLFRYDNGTPSTAIFGRQINTFIQSGGALFNDLRGFPGYGGMIVMVAGAAASNDGGQGFFEFVQLTGDQQPPPDDDSTVLRLTTPIWPNGYWMRINIGIARAPVYVVDGNGTVIATGVRGALYLPFAVTITSANLLADQAGSCVVDIGSVPLASYTGAFANSITASDQPTLASAAGFLDTTLTGWTKAIPAGNCLIFKVVSSSIVTRLTITLGVLG